MMATTVTFPSQQFDEYQKIFQFEIIVVVKEEFRTAQSQAIFFCSV